MTVFYTFLKDIKTVRLQDLVKKAKPRQHGASDFQNNGIQGQSSIFRYSLVDAPLLPYLDSGAASSAG
jgi:hypothetical protein